MAKIEAELLKRILPSYRSPMMAVKWMKIISENNQKMKSVHVELSNVNQIKWNATLDTRDIKKRNQIVFSVLVY